MFLFSVIAGSATLVDIQGGTINATEIDPTDAIAAFQMNSSGVEETSNSNPQSFSVSHTWLKVGSASDYEINWQASGDTGDLTGASINTWLGLGTTRTWTLTDTTTGGASSVTGDLSIRHAATGTVIETVTLTLTANKDA